MTNDRAFNCFLKNKSVYAKKEFLPGVNILTLFRYFGCGTVLDFWHFSEKFLEKVILFHPKKWKTLPKFEKTKTNQKKLYASSIHPDHFHIEIVV